MRFDEDTLATYVLFEDAREDPVELRATEDALFWLFQTDSDKSGIRRMSLASHDVSLVTAGQCCPAAFEVRNDEVYWFDVRTWEIKRTAGGATTTLRTERDPISSIAVSGNQLFWSGFTTSSTAPRVATGFLRKVALDDAAALATTVAEGFYHNRLGRSLARDAEVLFGLYGCDPTCPPLILDPACCSWSIVGVSVDQAEVTWFVRDEPGYVGAIAADDRAIAWGGGADVYARVRASDQQVLVQKTNGLPAAIVLSEQSVYIADTGGTADTLPPEGRILRIPRRF
ncbi:MAG: hypothetical protein IT384_20440 [Deltaproteobacteria bacterium]|nr:hypothetical protein [Deltaproteobacteria bacterium]